MLSYFDVLSACLVMVEKNGRIHTQYTCDYILHYMPVCVCKSVCITVSLCLSLSLLFLSVTVYLPPSVSVYMSARLSLCLSISPSLYLSLFPFSIYLSLCVCLCINYFPFSLQFFIFLSVVLCIFLMYLYDSLFQRRFKVKKKEQIASLIHFKFTNQTNFALLEVSTYNMGDDVELDVWLCNKKKTIFKT